MIFASWSFHPLCQPLSIWISWLLGLTLLCALCITVFRQWRREISQNFHLDKLLRGWLRLLIFLMLFNWIFTAGKAWVDLAKFTFPAKESVLLFSASELFSSISVHLTLIIVLQLWLLRQDRLHLAQNPEKTDEV